MGFFIGTVRMNNWPSNEAGPAEGVATRKQVNKHVGKLPFFSSLACIHGLFVACGFFVCLFLAPRTSDFVDA